MPALGNLTDELVGVKTIRISWPSLLDRLRLMLNETIRLYLGRSLTLTPMIQEVEEDAMLHLFNKNIFGNGDGPIPIPEEERYVVDEMNANLGGHSHSPGPLYVRPGAVTSPHCSRTDSPAPPFNSNSNADPSVLQRRRLGLPAYILMSGRCSHASVAGGATSSSWKSAS